MSKIDILHQTTAVDIFPELGELLLGLNKETVLEVTEIILKNPNYKQLLLTQIVHRILIREAVTHGDEDAIKRSRPSFSTLSMLNSEDFGHYRLSDIEISDGSIMLKAIRHGGSHSTSIKKAKMVEILRSTFLGESSSTQSEKVPVTQTQEVLLKKVIQSLQEKED